jgi:glyceraldehyde 3-phosphate dehydrogenase (phosphorylating)
MAINGLGRIGRAALKILLDTDGLDLIAVNDIADVDNLAYLLKYDTVYGRYQRAVTAADGALMVDGRRIAAFAERDPANLPWADLGVDLVLECTGVFKTEDDLKKHIQAGASFVILSAPTTSETVPTVVHGVNHSDGAAQIISCASCTTNCITPVVEIAHRHIGVQRAVMTTIHAYTGGQRLVDSPSKNFLRGRAGAVNLVPTSTGLHERPLLRCPSWPAGSTGSRCVPRSRSGRSPTSCSSRTGRPPHRRSTMHSGRRFHQSNTKGFSAYRRIRWCPPTLLATRAPPLSTWS